MKLEVAKATHESGGFLIVMRSDDGVSSSMLPLKEPEARELLLKLADALGEELVDMDARLDA
jgi:hypothetical protein